MMTGIQGEKDGVQKVRWGPRKRQVDAERETGRYRKETKKVRGGRDGDRERDGGHGMRGVGTWKERRRD